MDAPPADHPHPNRGCGVSSTGPCRTRCSPSSLPGVERVSLGPGPTSAGSARDREPGGPLGGREGSQASAGTVTCPSARPQLPLSLGLDHSASRPRQESMLTALTLIMDVGPGTRTGQAAWAPGGSGHAGGVSLEKGKKVRCGGPRDAGRARRKPWSQQTLVSPRLWPEGNQMLPVLRLSLPVLRLSSQSSVHPPLPVPLHPPGPPSVLPALRLSSQSSVHSSAPGPPSVLPALRLSSQSPVSPSQPSRQKLWSQQMLVSPRLWPKGNQMLPVLCPSLLPLPWLFLIRSPSPCPVDPAVMNPRWRIPPPHTPPEHSRCSVAVRGIALSPVPHCELAQMSSSPSHLPPQAPAASCFSSASGPHLTRHG